jgi:hypothetical protein
MHCDEPAKQMGDNTLNIRTWDPTTMAPDATCLAVGKRHAGKSTLMTDVMWYLRERLDLVLGMNPTENASNPTLGKFLPPAFIYERYDEEKIKHVLEWQRRAVANGKGMRVGLILDDCMGETNKDGTKKKIMSSGEIGKIFKIGRHRKLFFWCTLQYMRDCPPDARSNTDLLFLYNLTSPAERLKCYKDFFGMISTFADFCNVLDMCTKGYNCLVLDTRIAMRDPMNCIFTYRAKQRNDEFRVGRDVFWKLSDFFYVNRSDNAMEVSRVLGQDPLRSATSVEIRSKGMIIKKVQEEDDNK